MNSHVVSLVFCSILTIIFLTNKKQRTVIQYAVFGDPDENRTRVTAVKGRCLNRLTTGPDIGGYNWI